MMAGLGAAALAPMWTSASRAQTRSALALQAKASSLTLRPNGPATPVWSLQGPELRFKRGETLDVAFGNELPLPVVLRWRGIDGLPAIGSLAGRPPLSAGAQETQQLPLRHAGTFLCDLNLLGDRQPMPSQARALIVQESDGVTVDRDEVLLIEDWRVRPDGTAMAPGSDPGEAVSIHTINGHPSFELSARPNQRIRLRIISGCQRAVIAVKLDGLEVRVMAIDSQPSEPFQARSGALVLAPGGRVDAFIDMARLAGTEAPILLHDGKEARAVGKIRVSGEPARPAPLPPAPPLPSNGLPEQLDLRSAARINLALGGPQSNWVAPKEFATKDPLAFRAGRTVVLALTNPGPLPTVFHLHGHHFRLLDKLDDGWKPYWLDTLAVEPGQTQRIAFRAEYPGRYLIESVATDWAAPRLVRWYSVA